MAQVQGAVRIAAVLSLLMPLFHRIYRLRRGAIGFAIFAVMVSYQDWFFWFRVWIAMFGINTTVALGNGAEFTCPPNLSLPRMKVT